MKHVFIAVAALVFTGCGGQVVEVDMRALNDSGQDGKATLTQEGNNVRVVIDIQAGSDTGEQLAHVHEGNCPGLGSPIHDLTALKGGRSTTVIQNTTVDKLSKTAINVHNSVTPSRYVSCGEIP